MTDLVRRLWRRLRSEAVRRACAGQGWRLLASALLSSAAALLESVSLILLTAMALRVAGTESTQIGSLPALSPDLGLPTLVAAMAGVIVGRLMFQVLASFVTSRAIASLVAERRREAVSSYLASHWLAQAETDSGQLQDLTNNFAVRIGQLLGNLAQLINRGLSAVIMLVAAFVVSPIAAAGVLALSALVFALLAPLRLKIRRFARRGSHASLELGRRVAEMPGLVREIRTYAVDREVRAEVERPIETLRSNQTRGEIAIGLGAPLFQAIALAGFTAILALADLLFGNDVASLGAVVLVAFRSLSYGQAMLSNVNRVTDLTAWADRFDQTVARFCSSPANYGGEELPPRPVLELDGVGFHYPHREIAALEGVSCRIGHGQAVGLVGPTGSGKSTFVALVLRLIEPTRGQYRIDGRPAREFSAASWGRSFAFVTQAPEIIGGTIGDNVRFFRRVSDAAVERALRAAHLWQEVEAMPHGVETPIGLAGSNLSGGQRQRLALARALAGEPNVLILDEPTSALDPLSEKAIVDALAALRGEVTILTVAHRLSTLSGCDLILVLEDGRLVQAAPPSELAALPGFYARSLTAGGFAAGAAAAERPPEPPEPDR